MGKNKQFRFNEMKTFSHVVQPEFDEIFKNNHELKGFWKENFFKNNNPITLELGCGKGEYTIALAEANANKNFLGIDIKGARMWIGARKINDNKISNAGFLRTRIEFINSFFINNEVDEIWITFPDPQAKKRRNKKRLTSAGFLNFYRSFLKNNGLIHLKTDSKFLYNYTLNLLNLNNIPIVVNTDDLYNSNINLPEKELLNVQTFYEQMFLAQNITITYICFKLPNNIIVNELDESSLEDLLNKYATK